MGLTDATLAELADIFVATEVEGALPAQQLRLLALSCARFRVPQHKVRRQSAVVQSLNV